MHVRYVARSDAGLGRDGNEDAGLANPHVLAVADGMGGHAAGEVASQAAVNEFAEAEWDDGDPLERLAALLTAANERIRRLAAQSPAREGMGTTATAVMIDGRLLADGRLAVGHIGDSRAYLLRQSSLVQMTHDHTFVQSLVDDAQITPAQARHHPARSVVTNALQGQDVVEPDLALVDVSPGDRLLLCSDGLSDVLTDDVIAEVLGSTAELDEVADELIRLGLDQGGPDNITVVVADIVDGEPGNAPTYVVGSAAAPPQ